MKRLQQIYQDSKINCSSRQSPRLTYENQDSDTNTYTSSQKMTSFSSSSHHATPMKNDVFISFRGKEIRQTFLSHLVKALEREQIEVFVDDKLQEGDELLSSLFKAIEESQIALIIFSQEYASSKWCLEELVKINECRKNNRKIIIPIFYNIDPSDVRHQKGCFQDAFISHKEMFKDNIKKWRTAMKEVANLSGFHYTKNWTEAKLVEVVVQRVLTRLKITMCKVNIKGLVGIHKPIASLQSLISCNESEDVGVIGIWGMGGLGKTTIARVLFNTICSEFEGCCFLANVREQFEKDGITDVKRKIFSTLLEENNLHIDISCGVPDHVVRRLKCKKTLIVLDDVNNLNQFKNLIEKDWLSPGSRIIVTTRDKHVIAKEADHIYEVKALGSHDALELLKLHAFNEKCPQMNWHDEVIKKVLEYAKGIPLALEVLGSLLYGKSAEEWESQLQKLQKVSCADIQDVLKMSYEGLDCEEQNVFLYLACFFRNYDEKTKTLLDASCGYSTGIILKTLQDKALIIVSRSMHDLLGDEISHLLKHGQGSIEKVFMHDLIREMGRSIEKSGKRKHMWDHNEICHLLKHGQGSKYIESITFDMSRIGDMSLSSDCFTKMFNLKLLRVYNSSYSSSRLHLPSGFGILSSDIRLFHWDQYPSESFPVTFNLENLVELNMKCSRVKKLWSGVQNIPNLKIMNLMGSHYLVELPDLSKASNLEDLNLNFCENLVSVHSSVFCLHNVKRVLLCYCHNLEELPAIQEMQSLTILDLSLCKRLKHLPDSIYNLTSLEYLSLRGCSQLIIPPSLHIFALFNRMALML